MGLPSLSPPHGRLFAPHGHAEFRAEGRRLLGIAEGPFNLELALTVERLIIESCRSMQSKGVFDHLCEFRNSVLASPEALRQFGKTIRRLGEEGIAPVRFAYVFAPALEGGAFLAPQFARAYAAAGLTLCIFESRDEALDWLDANPL